MRISGLALGLLLVAAPGSTQPAKAQSAPRADRVCQEALQDGTAYEVWDRVLVKEWEGQPLYVRVQAYYRPGTGEILWWSTGFSKKAYDDLLTMIRKQAGSECGGWYRHIQVLRDGEWVDFWAQNGRIVVSHSNQKFSSREKAWAYINEYWREGSYASGGPAKRALEINLFDQLGREFFRPKSLEFDARPYSYESLISVKKVGSNWELLIKGADEPNRATVLLDKDFKLVKATKITPAN